MVYIQTFQTKFGKTKSNAIPRDKKVPCLLFKQTRQKTRSQFEKVFAHKSLDLFSFTTMWVVGRLHKLKVQNFGLPTLQQITSSECLN